MKLLVLSDHIYLDIERSLVMANNVKMFKSTFYSRPLELKEDWYFFLYSLIFSGRRCSETFVTVIKSETAWKEKVGSNCDLFINSIIHFLQLI